MKHNLKSKKLVFKKETVSNLALNNVQGGLAEVNAVKLTEDYSECGTGPATIVPCMCPTYYYSDCGTGPLTIDPCMC